LGIETDYAGACDPSVRSGKQPRQNNLGNSCTRASRANFEAAPLDSGVDAGCVGLVFGLYGSPIKPRQNAWVSGKSVRKKWPWTCWRVFPLKPDARAKELVTSAKPQFLAK
jgi:hypothetical protein